MIWVIIITAVATYLLLCGLAAFKATTNEQMVSRIIYNMQIKGQKFDERWDRLVVFGSMFMVCVVHPGMVCPLLKGPRA